MTVDHYFPTFSVALSGFDRPACFVESTLVVLDAPVGFVVSRLPALDIPAGFEVFVGAFVTLSGLLLRLTLAVEPPSVSTTSCTYNSAVLLVMHAFTVDIYADNAHQACSPPLPTHVQTLSVPPVLISTQAFIHAQYNFSSVHFTLMTSVEENIHRIQEKPCRIA